AHPDAIGPEQMAQRLVDRAEERAALAPPLFVRQRIRDAVQILVLPAIVARHALHIGGIDHGPCPRCRPGRAERDPGPIYPNAGAATVCPMDPGSQLRCGRDDIEYVTPPLLLRVPAAARPWLSRRWPGMPPARGSRDREAPCGRPRCRPLRARRQ